MDHSDCIFCHIIEGKIPCEKIFEDEHVISFLDIHPVNPGHTLVVPKLHLPTISDLPDDVVTHLFTTVRNLSTPVKQAVGATGVNIEMNNGADAGQIVNHAHVHIIPRHHNDPFRHWPGSDATLPELSEMGKIVRKFL
jgi:histidine triad (HIT) family protein